MLEETVVIERYKAKGQQFAVVNFKRKGRGFSDREIRGRLSLLGLRLANRRETRTVCARHGLEEKKIWMAYGETAGNRSFISFLNGMEQESYIVTVPPWNNSWWFVAVPCQLRGDRR